MANHPQLTDAQIDVQGRVAALTLERDDVRNEFTGTELVDDIERTVDWINRELHREGGLGGDFCEVRNKYREDGAYYLDEDQPHHRRW